ncbi:hypothetical protein BDZ91DRAFT_786897 [Kalaharituber pfeilii]|nr:hypothetical protein BDZ91DRAFT_786897 [Kalaharituber pfeilii]
MSESRASEVPQRDRDLMEADDFLPDSKLDSLWEWFCAASQDNMDPQMIFIKLVNTVRKPYRDDILCSRGLQPSRNEDVQALQTKLSVAENSLQEKQKIIHELERRTREMEQDQQEYKQKVEADKRQLDLDLRSMSEEHEKYQQKMEYDRIQLELDLRTITEYQRPLDLGPTKVAIKSAEGFSERYIQKVKEMVTATSAITPWSSFELFRHQDGTVSFKYYHVNLQQTSEEVSWSDSCGSTEKFRLSWSGNSEVAIEPVDCPQRFLTMNPPRLQGIKTFFYLVLLA